MGLIGRRFGDFQIIREIGKGAVARVYLASDGRAAKAVKLFPPAHRGRAERELEVGRHLRHPHLNPVEEWLELDGNPGVVMPFVPGLRLSRWLAERAERLAFVRSFVGVVEAVGYLHGLGVVHRDLKPENIIVDRGERSVLFDFDLAYRPERDGPGRELAGTVAYLSPEQARGEAARPASDVYALGVILFWGLCGQVPFSGSPGEVVEAHRNEPPPALSGLDPALAPFEPLVSAMLSKEPGRRPDDVAAIAAELRRLAAIP